MNTEENKVIIDLHRFLTKKHSDSLPCNAPPMEQNLWTNRKIQLSPEEKLHIIPFFDGVYISSDNYMFEENLTLFIEQFNDERAKSGSSVRFIEKSVRKELVYLEGT